MPGCMGGFFWLGLQLDALINIHLLKFVLSFLGTAAGIYLTILLVVAGHKKQLKEV